MDPEQISVESIPEPQEIIDCRKALADVLKLVDAGSVEFLSIYVSNRDETYQIFQSCGLDRHQEAGIMMEMAMQRLSFVKKCQLPEELA